MAITTRGRYGRELTAKARNDTYTGMLLISLLAMIASCALLFFEWSSYGQMPQGGIKPPQVRGRYYYNTENQPEDRPR
jgi:hypothetical protein